MDTWPSLPGEFDDDRPFDADEFISRLVQGLRDFKISEYDAFQALISWNEGAWDEVLEILNELA